MSRRVLMCIGTKKGLFVAEAPKNRERFELRGPFAPGVAVYSALIDRREDPRLYASACNPFFGMKVLRSTDLGASFGETRSAPEFPKDDGRAMANIWSLETGPADDELWCGVEPASLFRSGDGGDGCGERSSSRRHGGVTIAGTVSASGGQGTRFLVRTEGGSRRSRITPRSTRPLSGSLAVRGARRPGRCRLDAV